MFGQSYLGNSLMAYLLYFGFVILVMLVGKTLTSVTRRAFRAFAYKTETKIDDLFLTLLEGPILFSLFILTLFLAPRFLELSASFADVLSKLIAVLLTVNVAWYVLRFVNGLLTLYLEPLAAKTDTDLDDHVLPLLKRLVRIFIFVLAGIMIIDSFGYDVTSLVAGLGLGGLAFALAAQDLVSNLFGGVAILVDKPFKIGDRVKVGDVDGFVREIGLRTTRIETFGGTMIVVPNSKMVDSIVENVSRERARRVVITLGVEYGTSPAKLQQAKRIVQRHVKALKGLKDECTVTFAAFGPSSLDIRVEFWINKEGMKEYWGVQDKLYTAILKDFDRAGIAFAFPTQTIHLVRN